MNYSNEEQERLAYVAGNTTLSDALARIAELESEVELLEEKLDSTETLEHWEKNNGPAQSYYEFFHDCYARLDGHYACPSVTSDYDKSVIFDAISKRE